MVAFPLPDIPPELQGSLMIEEVCPNYTNVYFLPSEKAMEQTRIDGNGKTLILEIDAQKDSVCIHPIIAFSDDPDFLQPKYNSLKTITLHGFDYGHAKNEEMVLSILNNMPSGFIKNYDYGLGFLRERGTLVRILKEWGVNHLVISTAKKSDINEESSTLILNYAEFEKIHENTKRIANRAWSVSRRLKGINTNNFLSNILGNPEKHPTQPYPKFINKLIPNLIAEATSAIDVPLEPQEQGYTSDPIPKRTKRMMEQRPETLVKLRNTIELVSLENLIERYQLMLDKTTSESDWQALFQHNPFILSMVFSSPITIIQGQASVGGVGIDRSGNTITDFLVKNSISNNATIIEIKTPGKKLLKSTTSYRKDLYDVSTELSGGVNQVLDQRMEFQQDINRLKVKSKGVWFESYYTTGVLIIGTMPSDEDRQKSFELFRKNSKDVVIITFDELLGKIKQLLVFLEKQTDATVKN